jgi:hypothetical protein
MYKAILNTLYLKIYVYFKNNLLSLSSLSKKEPDNLKSLVAKEFARPIESNKVSIEIEKPTRTKPKRQLVETLPLEEAVV